MSFVVVSDHDRIRYRLSNNIILIILDSENDPKN